jgi:hypothetical protein
MSVGYGSVRVMATDELKFFSVAHDSSVLDYVVCGKRFLSCGFNMRTAWEVMELPRGQVRFD